MSDSNAPKNTPQLSPNGSMRDFKLRVAESISSAIKEALLNSDTPLDALAGKHALEACGIAQEELAVSTEASLTASCEQSKPNNIPAGEKKEPIVELGDDWVVLQNELLYAISNLELDERRLIMYLSPLVRKSVELNPEQRVFLVQAKDFAQASNIDIKNAYSKLENIADSLINKSFTIWNFSKDEKEKGVDKKGVSWIGECEYLGGKGCLQVELTSTVVKMLSVFDKGHAYTKYQRWLITNMTSYGIILFELIVSCMYQSLESQEFSVKYLREKFDCVDTYANIAEFKRNVIDKAIKQVEENTSIRVSYSQKKEGRIVTDLVFSFEDTEIENGSKYIVSDNEAEPQLFIEDSYSTESKPEFVASMSDFSDTTEVFSEPTTAQVEHEVVTSDFGGDSFDASGSLKECQEVIPLCFDAPDDLGILDNQTLEQAPFKYAKPSKYPDPEFDTPDMFDDMFISKRQRHDYACKLADMPELAYLAKGDARRDKRVFENQIMNELVDSEKQDFYKPYLDMLGFKRE